MSELYMSRVEFQGSSRLSGICVRFATAETSAVVPCLLENKQRDRAIHEGWCTVHLGVQERFFRLETYSFTVSFSRSSLSQSLAMSQILAVVILLPQWCMCFGLHSCGQSYGATRRPNVKGAQWRSMWSTSRLVCAPWTRWQRSATVAVSLSLNWTLVGIFDFLVKESVRLDLPYFIVNRPGDSIEIVNSIVPVRAVNTLVTLEPSWLVFAANWFCGPSACCGRQWELVSSKLCKQRVSSKANGKFCVPPLKQMSSQVSRNTIKKANLCEVRLSVDIYTTTLEGFFWLCFTSRLARRYLQASRVGGSYGCYTSTRKRPW